MVELGTPRLRRGTMREGQALRAMPALREAGPAIRQRSGSGWWPECGCAGTAGEAGDQLTAGMGVASPRERAETATETMLQQRPRSVFSPQLRGR